VSTAEPQSLVPPEAPRQVGRDLQVGARIAAAATAFFFISFVFAYFYLRALNSNSAFRPHHIRPAQGYGIAILACVLGSVGAFTLGRRVLDSGREPAWRAGAAASLFLGLAAIAVQIAQFTDLGFRPTNGGYASVFVGWTGLFLLAWLSGLYWVETLLAQSLRRETVSVTDIIAPARLLRPAADACSVFLYLLAGVEVVTYVVLYLL
jgi:heme/copper-type cytochrome/quinol oxidase subunit 3